MLRYAAYVSLGITMKDIIVIDGSHGEGGGQVLRSALALSLVTGIPFRLERIRAGRNRPGLMRQHLTAVQAAAAVGSAHVEGAYIGSHALVFYPSTVSGGSYRFAVGTAGSATLVAQTVLPALLTAKERCTLVLEGGTHNPFAPPFDYLQRVFLPVLNRMGVLVRAELNTYGFYPAGGGQLTLDIEPTERLEPLHIVERGQPVQRSVRAVVANLDKSIARRELAIVRSKFPWPEECFTVEEVTNSRGPGNILLIEIEHEYIRECITAFGEQGVPAEVVASEAVRLARRYLSSFAPVGSHLADQLILPFAIAGSGSFRALPLSRHTSTNIDIVRKFLPIKISTASGQNESAVVFES